MVSPVDTLKIRAYGVKNPTHVKEERLRKTFTSLGAQGEKLTGKPMRYYPKDKAGNHDEWAALLATQYETATKLQGEIDQ